MQEQNERSRYNPNPFILIANYFFDSIPQDSFVIENEQLCQNLLTLYGSQPEPDLSDPLEGAFPDLFLFVNAPFVRPGAAG